MCFQRVASRAGRGGDLLSKARGVTVQLRFEGGSCLHRLFVRPRSLPQGFLRRRHRPPRRRLAPSPHTFGCPPNPASASPLSSSLQQRLAK